MLLVIKWREQALYFGIAKIPGKQLSSVTEPVIFDKKDSLNSIKGPFQFFFCLPCTPASHLVFMVPSSTQDCTFTLGILCRRSFNQH